MSQSGGLAGAVDVRTQSGRSYVNVSARTYGGEVTERFALPAKLFLRARSRKAHQR